MRKLDDIDIPDNWFIEPLHNCSEVQTGIAKGRKVDESEAITVPYLRVANVQDGYLDLEEIKTITIRKRELDRYLLKFGDVLLTEGGDFDKLSRSKSGQKRGRVGLKKESRYSPDALPSL